MTGKIVETFNINKYKFIIKWEEEKMSAFVLNRNYELQLPNSFVDVDCGEMEYVDGGFYISNSTLVSVTRAVFLSVGINPIGATLVGLGIWKVYTILVAGAASISARLGALSGPLGVALGIMGVGAVVGIGYTLADALIQGKGIDIGIKTTSFGVPYGLDVQVK